MTQLLPHADFDAARLDLIRRRVVYLALVVGCLLIALSGMAELVIRHARRPMRVMALSPAIGGVMILAGGFFKLRKRRATMTLRELTFRSSVVVTASIVMQMPAARVVASVMSDLLRGAGLQHAQIGALVPLFFSLLLVHLAASMIVPWSLWESARPVLAIALLALLATPFAPDPWPARFGGILGLILMGTPGMLWCWLRFSRLRQTFTLGFLSRRYNEVQRELETARRIHEKLFPAPIGDGPLLFDYRYEPMQQIGGDFVDVMRGPDGAASIVLVDVTGHGIPAALAVNRLHGEIKRTIAQQASQQKTGQPSEIIAALNDYMHLTLSDESVFGTAMAIRIEPSTHRIAWVSAGHPPAFLCRLDGRIEMLDSTVIMLGPIPKDSFDPAEQSCDFNDGDMLIAYTDGGIECRGKDDSQLGIEGLKQIVESNRGKPPARLLDAIMGGIKNFRAGAPEDDTLILAVQLSSMKKDRT